MNKESLMSQFIMRKMEYEDESIVLQELQEKPMSEGQVHDILTRGLSSTEKANTIKRYTPLLKELRGKGMIIPDNQISFKDFVESNPGCLIMRESSYYQMELQEVSAFKQAKSNRNTPFKMYSDMPLSQTGQGGDFVHHYITRGKYTGFGWKVKTHLISTENGAVTNEDDLGKLQAARSIYAQGRKEIDAILIQLNLDPVPLEKRGYGLTSAGIGGSRVSL